MIKINEDLYQFSAYIPFIDFTLHQYLLLSDEPVLISTGTLQQAEQILPEIQQLLGDRSLKFIFFPHYESDECGGLPVFQKAYPDVVTICSELSARELAGFGYPGTIEAKKQGDTLIGNGFEFEFVDYPSEVHLQNGLLFYEKTREIFFSSDLMLRFGNGTNQTLDSTWEAETSDIDMHHTMNPVQADALKNALTTINPKFIAVGHGFCINCK